MTAYDDSNVPPGSYCYHVKSVVNGIESVPSNQASAVVPSQALSLLLSTSGVLILVALILVVVGFCAFRGMKTTHRAEA
jgi:hypothetical protein